MSPGKWHLQVPKERRANLEFRLKLLRLAKGSPKNQAALRVACQQDILFYINSFVWTYDPRKQGGDRVGPWICYDYQERALFKVPGVPWNALDTRPEEAGILWCVEHERDLACQKSKDVGLTWLFLIVMDWLNRFQDYHQSLCISKSEKAVESESPNCLFWKIDFMHEHLPDWFGKVKRRDLSIEYLKSKSMVTGEASTGRAGVGGRATTAFVDEFPLIKEAALVRQRTSDTANVRFFNGTHQGTDTEFYDLCNTPEVAQLTVHWTQHPEKRKGLYRYDVAKGAIEVLDKTYHYPPDFQFVMSEAPAGGPYPGLRSPWYDAQVARKGTTRAVAIDLDIDPGGSASQFFNPITIRTLQATYCREPVWEGHIAYDRDSGQPERLIEAPGGPLKLWIHPKPDGSMPLSSYGAGADISTGNGRTNSCLSIGDGQTGLKVLEYATCTVEPKDLAPICTAICWLFKDDNGRPAYFAWEHHGPGLSFGNKVVELLYPRIYWREAHSTLGGGKVSNIPGWYPSNDTKLLLFEDYRAALDSRAFVNPCSLALKECLPYRYTPNGMDHPHDVTAEDPTAARVNHGDRATADALCWKMMKSFGIVKPKPEPKQEIPVGSFAWRRQLRARREEEAMA